MDFRRVFDTYRSDLQSIDDLLIQAANSRNHRLTTSSRQLVEAGGKRIRPLFALLCSELGPKQSKERVHTLAAALELVHMATLVHDDVIDDAATRRGSPTVKAQYGNRPAMYTGDFLFARAIHLLASLQSPAIHIEMSNAIVSLCEGEIEQIRDFYNLKQPLKQYLRRIERKTALLISVSCSLGATVSESDRSTISMLRRFGHYTGMAFQMIDDILDLTGSQAIVGKPVGNDLLQGNITLPVLYAATQSERTASELQKLIHPEMTSEDAKQAVSLVRECGGIEYASALADRYLTKALDTLGPISHTSSGQALGVVAQFVNRRSY